MAIERMRHARFVRRLWPRGDDAQMRINLHGIGIDDGATEFLGQRQSQRRLAAGGRPCNKHRLIGFHRMTHVATLIGPPNTLTPATLALARAALPGTAEPIRLGPDAADISFSSGAGIDQRSIAEHLREILGDIDVVVQPIANRRKKLFLADMDSTIIGQECIDELADFVGLKAHVAAITERAMRGEIAFEPALKERVALLKGLPVTTIDEVIAKRITLTPGARTLVATMRSNGAMTCMVSGCFTLFTQPIAAMIGFDETRANRLTLDGD